MNKQGIDDAIRLHGLWLDGKGGGARADLSGADLSGADLRGADLSGADLDFSAWPIWCGGTGATLDRRLSLQLIYHTFNNNHTDADIAAALEPLRALAQEFIDKQRSDAPELRGNHA